LCVHNNLHFSAVHDIDLQTPIKKELHDLPIFQTKEAIRSMLSWILILPRSKSRGNPWGERGIITAMFRDKSLPSRYKDHKALEILKFDTHGNFPFADKMLGI
jgi:hypothetical protein